VGAFKIPASVAASLKLKSDAFLLKYLSEASCTPQTPCPKYELFKYISRIFSFEYSFSISMAKNNSLILRNNV
jgi:hypothetical protein